MVRKIESQAKGDKQSELRLCYSNKDKISTKRMATADIVCERPPLRVARPLQQTFDRQTSGLINSYRPPLSSVRTPQDLERYTSNVDLNQCQKQGEQISKHLLCKSFLAENDLETDRDNFRTAEEEPVKIQKDENQSR